MTKSTLTGIAAGILGVLLSLGAWHYVLGPTYYYVRFVKALEKNIKYSKDNKGQELRF